MDAPNSEPSATPRPVDHVTVVGAGLTGTLLASYLARRGYEVDVYEKRPDVRNTDLEGGRSINMAISTRGWRALEEIDLAERTRERSIPMYGRMIHDPEGNRDFQSYGRPEQAISSVSRTELTGMLIDEAEHHDSVEFHFAHTCEGVDLDAPAPRIEDVDTGETTSPETDLVVGADGAYSAVRTEMQKSGRFDYSQEYLEHGYKELTIPAAEDGDWRFDRHALHIWPRHDFMFIALPNLDGSFTGTLFLPFEGARSFDALETGSDARAFFADQFPDLVDELPRLEEQFESNPTSSLVTIRCEPYHYRDRVLLAGDAAHAVVPFYGQGMNASWEDCVILDDLLESFDDDWSRVLPAFSQRRKPDADAIADLALYNYVEMRSKVADPNFLWRKKLEKRLDDLFPRAWRPLYSMVTFSTIPYAEALDRGRAQDRLLDWLFPGTVSETLE